LGAPSEGPPDVVLARHRAVREQIEQRKAAEWELAQDWTRSLDPSAVTIGQLVRIEREIEEGCRILDCKPDLINVRLDNTPTGRYVAWRICLKGQAPGINDLGTWIDSVLKARWSADAIGRAIEHLARQHGLSLSEAGAYTIAEAVLKLNQPAALERNAQEKKDPGADPAPRGKPGPKKPRIPLTAEDRRIVARWHSGEYRTFADLKEALKGEHPKLTAKAIKRLVRRVERQEQRQAAREQPSG
jgi:hypothetical protein